MSKAVPDAPAKAEEKVSPLLKMVLELGPLVVFFFANSRGEWLAGQFPVLSEMGGPIFIATGLFMAATAIALVVSWILTRTLPMMPLISGIVVFVFGALTLWLQNDTFIKMKPTIVYALFAAILLGGLAFNRPLLGYVFDQAFQLDDDGWRKLTFRWGLFFVVCAILNEVVWRSLGAFYPPDIADEYWAAFKLFGFTALTFIFVFSQMPLIMRHSLDQQVRK